MTQKILTLDSLVDGANTTDLPTKEQIRKGYRQDGGPMADGDDYPKLFAWGFLYTDYLIEAGKLWNGQVLVDLGCGRQLDGYIISKLAGARAYIAVDPYNLSRFYQRLTNEEENNGADELNETIKKIRAAIQTRGYDKVVVERLVQNIDNHLNREHIPVALVAEDMVSAMKRLPSDSVSIMTAGLDKCILWRDEYANLAEDEISRVLHPNGAYLAMSSRLNPAGLKKSDSFKDDFSFKKFTK